MTDLTLADILSSPEALDKAAHEFSDLYVEQHGELDPEKDGEWVAMLREMLDDMDRRQG